MIKLIEDESIRAAQDVEFLLVGINDFGIAVVIEIEEHGRGNTGGCLENWNTPADAAIRPVQGVI